MIADVLVDCEEVEDAAFLTEAGVAYFLEGVEQWAALPFGRAIIFLIRTVCPFYFVVLCDVAAGDRSRLHRLYSILRRDRQRLPHATKMTCSFRGHLRGRWWCDGDFGGSLPTSLHIVGGRHRL